MTRAARRAVLPRVLLAVLLCAALPWAAAEVAVPPLKARVTDLASTLSQEQRAALERELAAFEARKGSQVAVLLVPTTQPETVEQYAIRVFDQWKLGRKGVDDGVLLLIAKNDRKLRIEVGYGLEGALNDATARRIIEEYITPRFKQGDFHGGISAGVERIIKVIDGEAMPPPARSGSSGFHGYGEWLPFGLVFLMLAMGLLRKLLGRMLAGIAIGAGAGIILYLLSGFIFVALVGGFIFGVIAALDQASQWGGMSSGGGWSSRGSSGGGFSGGGGSSGGGGASGSW